MSEKAVTNIATNTPHIEIDINTPNATVAKMVSTIGFDQYFRDLLLSVYGNPDLQSERAVLNKVTQSKIPDNTDKLTDPRLIVISNVRAALSAVLAIHPKEYKKPEYAEIKELVINMKDGDLAYTTVTPIRNQT